MQKTDAELMEASRDGNIRAFDELVGRYGDRIYAFALRFSGDRDMALDASQEAWIKVWKNRKKYDSKRGFSPWLFAIARNAVIDVMRKKRDWTFSSMSTGEDGDIGEDIVDETIEISKDLDLKIFGTALEETLKLITPDQRAVVILHDVEGMTFDEAGKVIGKPLNTVKSHYRRGIVALRRKLNEKGYVEP